MVRLLRHLLLPDWWVRKSFPRSALERIGQAIAGSERLHHGEICFAVEGGLPLQALAASCRARAEELFGLLKVWDTAENCGVLLYVQLVDRDIEIVADRGINARVSHGEWEKICRDMEQALRRGAYEEAIVRGVQEVSALLARHFPPRPGDRNELPNEPVRL